MKAGDSPSIDAIASVGMSVVIPTRDRGASIVAAIRSVLSDDSLLAELIVVDQSHDDRTLAAMEAFCEDPRVIYVRSEQEGISAALNQGIRRAATSFVAITGDDCEAEPGWMRAFVSALERAQNVAIVFGSVLPHPHPGDGSFSPSYIVTAPVQVCALSMKHRSGGTSACMALRRAAWERLGGFDEMLGVGAALRSAEETDLAIRALAAGYCIAETPNACVVHRNQVLDHERARLIERNWFGTGASFAKALKQWHFSIVTALAKLGIAWLRGRSGVLATMGPGDPRARALGAFVRGMWAGLRQPIDSRSGHFLPRVAS